MTDQVCTNCVVLPCSSDRYWAVPQNCLGEIVTVPTKSETPPEDICWRGELLPVVDFGAKDDLPWRDKLTGAGLVAVILGRKQETCPYFAVALRGDALAIQQLVDEDIEDLPDSEYEYAAAAFRMKGKTYQVPDLWSLQRAIGAGDLVA
ncbi:MAG: chemotaxis protein CheW [Pseudomonadota bacterium]